MLERWGLWFPSAGATGVSFARSRVEADAAGDRLLVHAAPPELEVTVRGADGRVLAEGRGLKRGASGPMSYLVRQGWWHAGGAQPVALADRAVQSPLSCGTPRQRRSHLVGPCRRRSLPVL